MCTVSTLACRTISLTLVAADAAFWGLPPFACASRETPKRASPAPDLQGSQYDEPTPRYRVDTLDARPLVPRFCAPFSHPACSPSAAVERRVAHEREAAQQREQITKSVWLAHPSSCPFRACWPHHPHASPARRYVAHQRHTDVISNNMLKDDIRRKEKEMRELRYEQEMLENLEKVGNPRHGLYQRDSQRGADAIAIVLRRRRRPRSWRTSAARRRSGSARRWKRWSTTRSCMTGKSRSCTSRWGSLACVWRPTPHALRSQRGGSWRLTPAVAADTRSGTRQRALPCLLR